MGHDVVFLPYHEACIMNAREKSHDVSLVSTNIYNHFLLHHTKKPFDLFFSYYHSLQVTPELFGMVKEKVFCVNYTTNFHQIDLYEPLLKAADLSVYVSKEAEPFFKSNTNHSYYMPFAGLSNQLQLNPNKNGKISFIGTSYGPRAYYIWRCLQNGLPIDIYGVNWLQKHKKRAFLRTLKLQSEIVRNHSHLIDTSYRCLNDIILFEIANHYSHNIHNPLSDQEYANLLSNSSIVLNIPESRFGHEYSNPHVLIGANLRDFEVPVAGSLLITQKNEEICTLFSENNEMITFSNEWEMIDKLRFYISHPEISFKIATAGHHRVKAEHLWEHRFDALFNHLTSNYL